MTSIGPHLDDRQVTSLRWIAVIQILVIAITWTAVFLSTFGYTRDVLIKDHFPVIIGLPVSGVAACVIVFLYRQTSGPIEIEVHQMKARGATGPVILWIMCFWSISGAIRMLW